MARKILLPLPTPIKQPAVEVPSHKTILNNCLILMGKEVSRILDKSNRGHAILQDEVRTISSFMKIMIDLGKLEIEQQRADDLSKLTDQELLTMGSKALKKLKDELKIGND